MNSKFFTLLVSFFIATTVYSQNLLNQYKYVIVPNAYGFLNEPDQYQLNSLTEFLLNKSGFEAIMEDEEYPQDLSTNRCLALKTDVLKDSGMFKTKLKVQLKDCNGKVVFTSEMGESREKEFKTAYNFALRDAFISIEALNHKYVPNGEMAVVSTSNTQVKTKTNQEIEQLKAEIENLKKAKETQVPVVKSPEPKVLVAPVLTPVTKVKTEQATPMILYAQEIENGFQLVDRTPKVVYKIQKTGQKDVFLVEGINAIIYKKGDLYVFEYNTDEGLKKKELNIKF